MTKFLVDENVPESVLRLLSLQGIHVTQLGQRLTDTEIWEYARENGFTIVTRDADYFDRLTLYGTPPKVVWIRTGNLRLRALACLLQTAWPAVSSLLPTSDLVIIHTDRVEGLKFG